MKTTSKWRVTVGLIVVAGIAGPVQSAAASSPVRSLSFTIHVRNEAGVDSKTLKEAEKVASGIFQEAGVITQWVDAPLTSEDLHEASVDPRLFGLSQLRVNILPPAMSDRLNMPVGVTGLAPGAGPDRVLAYVFYDRVEGLAQREAQRQFTAQSHGTSARRAAAGQILGVVIAHEIGHILLNLAVHTKEGIMRGNWDLHDLREIAYGYLNFTKQQGKVIQSEVARRVRQQDILEMAGRSEKPLTDSH